MVWCHVLLLVQEETSGTPGSETSPDPQERMECFSSCMHHVCACAFMLRVPFVDVNVAVVRALQKVARNHDLVPKWLKPFHVDSTKSFETQIQFN